MEFTWGIKIRERRRKLEIQNRRFELWLRSMKTKEKYSIEHYQKVHTILGGALLFTDINDTSGIRRH